MIKIVFLYLMTHSGIEIFYRRLTTFTMSVHLQPFSFAQRTHHIQECGWVVNPWMIL